MYLSATGLNLSRIVPIFCTLIIIALACYNLIMNRKVLDFLIGVVVGVIIQLSVVTGGIFGFFIFFLWPVVFISAITIEIIKKKRAIAVGILSSVLLSLFMLVVVLADQSPM